MLDAFLLSAIVLHTPNVEVVPARLKILTNEMRLQEICAAKGNFSACTLFVGFKLNATCSTGGAGWRLSASARFQPMMFLVDIGAMRHEYDHIKDVRQSAEQSLTELRETTFSSAEACQDMAARARKDFGARMKQFARDSHAKRHPLSTVRFLGQQ